MSGKRTDNIVNECRAVYESVFESTENNMLSKEDLALVLRQSGRNPTNSALVQYWKPGRNGMEYSDFVNICRQEPVTTKEDLIKAFEKMDINGDGYISREEFLQAMISKGEKMTMREVIKIMDQVDENQDGKLDYNEFSKLILSNAKPSKTSSIKATAAPRKAEPEARFKKEENVAHLGSQKSPSAAICIKEPRGWDKLVRRGTFHLDESDDGKEIIMIQALDISVKRHTKLIISIEALQGLKLLDCKADLGLLMLQGSKCFAINENVDTKGNVALQCTLTPGEYTLIPLTSGALFKSRGTEAKTKAKIIKKVNGEVALSSAFKEALSDMFKMSDLDANGGLSKEEFAFYNVRTSGEILDDEAWEFAKSICSMPNDELTEDDFMKLHLEEAKQDETCDDLWITLDSMGFNKQLFINEAFPFEITLHVEAGLGALTLRTQDPNVLQNVSSKALIELVKYRALTTQSLDSNVKLFVFESSDRVLVGVENSATNSIQLQLDCSSSSGLVGDLQPKVTLRPGRNNIALHAVPLDMKRSYCFSGTASLVN